MNALARPEVGDYLNRHFVSTYVKVGTFALVNGQKQGGNVATYFCLPDGSVLHAIAGAFASASAAIDAWTYWPNSRMRIDLPSRRPSSRYAGRRWTLQYSVKNVAVGAVKTFTIALDFSPVPTLLSPYDSRTCGTRRPSRDPSVRDPA